MKTKVIIIFILLIAGTSQLSAYKSIFGNDTTRWHVFEMAADAGGTYDIYTYSDTLIHKLPYHKIYWDYMGFSGDHSHSYPSKGGFIYEDTLIGKYYFTYMDYQGNVYDVLFMDMSLEKGDTFKIVHDFRYYWRDTVEVDTVYYIDNRKIIEFNWVHFSSIHGGDYNQKLKFIEGIGPSNGFYMSIRDYSPETFSLLCKFENSEKIYSTADDDGDCYFVGGGSVEDKVLEKHIIIYPNPATEKVSIEISDFNAERLFCNVYNVLGQMIQSMPIISNITELKIEQRGFYYFVITDGKRAQVQKVIVGND
jgi:hypothetical protein